MEQESLIDTTLFEQNALKKVGEYLYGLPHLRIEWSLELSKVSLLPRSKPIFWLGQQGSQSNRLGFEKLDQLLVELACPEVILELKKRYDQCAFYQGLSLSLTDNNASKCWFVHYFDAESQQEKRLAYKWSITGEITMVDYHFHLFTEKKFIPQLQTLIHSDYQSLFTELISERRLIQRSGFWLQKVNRQVKEVYFTYPWQPKLTEFMSAHRSSFSGRYLSAFAPYQTYRFRHIGLSAANNQAAKLTFYFTAPIKATWPKNYLALQNLVAESANNIHSILLKKLALTPP